MQCDVACAVGALAVTTTGAQDSMPKRDAVEALLDSARGTVNTVKRWRSRSNRTGLRFVSRCLPPIV